MSLLGNRGRFTQDKNENINNKDSEYSSVLSLIGKNPSKLFGISNYEILILINISLKKLIVIANIINELKNIIILIITKRIIITMLLRKEKQISN